MSNRQAFEKAAYEHYLQRNAAGKTDHNAEGDGPPDALFWKDENGNYGVQMFNAAWWGWQAGVDAAARECERIGAIVQDRVGAYPVGQCEDAIRRLT